MIYLSLNKIGLILYGVQTPIINYPYIWFNFIMNVLKISLMSLKRPVYTSNNNIFIDNGNQVVPNISNYVKVLLLNISIKKENYIHHNI